MQAKRILNSLKPLIKKKEKLNQDRYNGKKSERERADITQKYAEAVQVRITSLCDISIRF